MLDCVKATIDKSVDLRLNVGGNIRLLAGVHAMKIKNQKDNSDVLDQSVELTCAMEDVV